jgi:AraC family cel operon transcriptional repressor
MSIRILEKERFVDMRTEISYRIVYSASERFVEHAHDYYELFVMLSGKARHTCNGKTVKISAGDIVFIRPSDLHCFLSASGEEFSFINLTYTESTLLAMQDFLGSGFPFRALISARECPTSHLGTRELAALESRITYLATIDHSAAEDLKTALRITVIGLITSHFYNYTAPTEEMPLWLERLLVTMRNDGNFVSGLDRMVEISGKTREHLSRTIKKYLNQTATEYINELRLNYIANMLRSSRARITDIILDSGFTSISRATDLFKKKYGMTMREFRDNA